jgi:Domain of unknown function (DUF1772)
MTVWAVCMIVFGGLFSGGATAFAWERVPAWRTMPLPEFRSDFANAIHKADRVQPALLVVAIVATVGFAVSAVGSARTLALIGAAGFMAILIGSGAVLVPLQRRIIASTPRQVTALEPMRRLWFRGHVGRSALGVASFLLTATAAAVQVG